MIEVVCEAQKTQIIKLKYMHQTEMTDKQMIEIILDKLQRREQ